MFHGILRYNPVNGSDAGRADGTGESGAGTDGLSDLPLNKMIEKFKKVGKTASFLAYQPTQSFHVVQMEEDGKVNSISPISSSGLWINAGYFVFRKEIFDYMQEGEDLVVEPFQRLIKSDEFIS